MQNYARRSKFKNNLSIQKLGRRRTECEHQLQNVTLFYPLLLDEGATLGRREALAGF